MSEENQNIVVFQDDVRERFRRFLIKIGDNIRKVAKKETDRIILEKQYEYMQEIENVYVSSGKIAEMQDWFITDLLDAFKLPNEEEEDNLIPPPILKIQESINGIESFTLPECLIRYSEKPNILFCNCGHLCLCENCNDLRNFNKCPVCKTNSEIKRKI